MRESTEAVRQLRRPEPRTSRRNEEGRAGRGGGRGKGEEGEEVGNRWTIMITTAHRSLSLNRNERKTPKQLFVSWTDDQIKRTSLLVFELSVLKIIVNGKDGSLVFPHLLNKDFTFSYQVA